MFSFIAIFFSYEAWFFLSESVFGKIIDRNKKKYRILDRTSNFCITVVPLMIPLSYVILQEYGYGHAADLHGS